MYSNSHFSEHWTKDREHTKTVSHGVKMLYPFIPLMQIAKSLVMKPASMVSTQTASRLLANLASSGLLSSLARWERPRVHAKMEAGRKEKRFSYIITTSSTRWDPVITSHSRHNKLRNHSHNLKYQKLNSPPFCPTNSVLPPFSKTNTIEWLRYKVSN